MMSDKIKRVDIKIGLNPDKDYSLRDAERFHMKWDGIGWYGIFSFTRDTPQYNFEDEHDIQMSPSWRACTLLEKMLCEIHVSHTHHYVIKYLYDMFDEAITAIGKDRFSFESSVDGNYEGTYIEVCCRENI